MPLLELWRSNPSAFADYSIEQVVSMAGGGKLHDNSACSEELRAYLREVPTGRLAGYLDHCLSRAFHNSGFVLQDIVNELGRRLDYEVENGRYQGTGNTIGFDGLWRAPEGNSLIVEVKTTDAYRISLDKPARYRSQLMAEGRVTTESSILIVTGRDDTGELEAQIRGSRHAWDMRLISAEALANLVRIKESTEGQDTARKIRRLLIPMEFTRLDGLIDVIFATTKDVETAAQAETSAAEPPEVPSEGEGESSGKIITDHFILNAKREAIVAALARQLGTNLIRHSRALYWDSSHERRVVVTISKRYLRARLRMATGERCGAAAGFPC